MHFADTYLDLLLSRYEANFDITKNYRLGDITYPAYAWFYSLSEKYVLKKEATLWSIRAYEHVLFIKENQLTKDKLSELMHIIQTKAEPLLVRKCQKYPEKDHMCTYLTFVVITDKDTSSDIAKAVNKFHFDKGYLLNFRGHSEARLATISMESGQVLTNRSGKDIKPLLSDVYTKACDIIKSQMKAAAEDSYEFVS